MFAVPIITQDDEVLTFEKLQVWPGGSEPLPDYFIVDEKHTHCLEERVYLPTYVLNEDSSIPKTSTLLDQAHNAIARKLFMMKGFHHKEGRQAQFINGIAILYNLIPYQRRAKNEGCYLVTTLRKMRNTSRSEERYPPMTGYSTSKS